MLKVAEPDSPIRTLSPEKIVISAGAGELFTYTSPMLVSDPKGSLSFSWGSTWARHNAGRSKRGATTSETRPIEIAGLRFCFAAETGVVVKITGICLTEKRSRADRNYLAFLWFIVDREVTPDGDP